MSDTDVNGSHYRNNPIAVDGIISMARSTGFEPAISSVTGRRDNHFTTSAWAFQLPT